MVALKEALSRRIVEELMASFSEFVTLSHLVGALGEDRRRVYSAMRKLERAGAATVVQRVRRYSPPNRSWIEITYRPRNGLERMLEHKRLAHDTGWDRMWRAIRSLSKAQPTFTRQELARTASDDQMEVTIGNAREFTKRLRRAGHIRERSRGRWELVGDPGPGRPATPRAKAG